ncbi:MAG: hypothetical protein Kapaf2KO_08280 [Candidatus Kapaibacteriales bacterium]
MSSLIETRDGREAKLSLKGQFVGGEETESLQAYFGELSGDELERLSIDFGGVTYLNSLALGVLISGSSKAQRSGIDMWLTEIPKNIMELFELTKLDKIFNIKES